MNIHDIHLHECIKVFVCLIQNSFNDYYLVQFQHTVIVVSLLNCTVSLFVHFTNRP